MHPLVLSACLIATSDFRRWQRCQQDVSDLLVTSLCLCDPTNASAKQGMYQLRQARGNVNVGHRRSAKLLLFSLNNENDPERFCLSLRQSAATATADSEGH